MEHTPYGYCEYCMSFIQYSLPIRDLKSFLEHKFSNDIQNSPWADWSQHWPMGTKKKKKKKKSNIMETDAQPETILWIQDLLALDFQSIKKIWENVQFL